MSPRGKDILIWSLTVLLLVALGVIGYLLPRTETEPTSDAEVGTLTANSKPSPDTHDPTASKKTSVIIYSEEVSNTKTGDHSWPSVKLWKKSGGSDPVLLAQVGKENEYPDGFVLSPDHQKLIINLRSKLQLLDLGTKELRDLYTAKYQSYSATFSPDSSQAFIWDQSYGSSNNNYQVVVIDLSTREQEIIANGVNTTIFSGQEWRTDNKIVLAEPQGEFAEVWYFDLSQKKAVKSSTDQKFGLLSQTGLTMASDNTYIDDICNDFSASARSTYEIVNPVSGTSLQTIGDPTRHTTVLAISPDDTEVLYSTDQPWTKREDCGKVPVKNYFRVTVASGVITPVTNLDELLVSWGGEYVGATAVNENVGGKILVNGQESIRSTRPLQIAAQYYE